MTSGALLCIQTISTLQQAATIKFIVIKDPSLLEFIQMCNELLGLALTGESMVALRTSLHIALESARQRSPQWLVTQRRVIWNHTACLSDAVVVASSMIATWAMGLITTSIRVIVMIPVATFLLATSIWDKPLIVVVITM
jgi:hypothetical protein